MSSLTPSCRSLEGASAVSNSGNRRTKLLATIAAVLIAACWQCCRGHFLRNVLAQVPRGNSDMAAATLRTIFAQPDPDHVQQVNKEVKRRIDVVGLFPNPEGLVRLASAALNSDVDSLTSDIPLDVTALGTAWSPH